MAPLQQLCGMKRSSRSRAPPHGPRSPIPVGSSSLGVRLAGSSFPARFHAVPAGHEPRRRQDSHRWSSVTIDYDLPEIRWGRSLTGRRLGNVSLSPRLSAWGRLGWRSLRPIRSPPGAVSGIDCLRMLPRGSGRGWAKRLAVLVSTLIAVITTAGCGSTTTTTVIKESVTTTTSTLNLASETPAILRVVPPNPYPKGWARLTVLISRIDPRWAAVYVTGTPGHVDQVQADAASVFHTARRGWVVHQAGNGGGCGVPARVRAELQLSCV
jgi:hypothetical protein